MDIQQKIYIVIVEDSLVQAKKLKFLLEENGFEVSVSINGVEALRSIKERLPNLIISDIVMPDMDGYELCAKIKAEPLLMDIPVILLTTLSDPLDIIRGLQAQSDHFIIKPYEDQNLLTHIQNLMTNRELRKKGGEELGIEIIFKGQRFQINSERKQILDLLLSVYETAISRNEELIRTQNILQSTNKELIAANKELEAYSRTVSHDLRSPIAQIKSLIVLMNRDLNADKHESLISSIDFIDKVSDKMLMLVDELLNFSKVQHSQLNIKHVNLTTIAEELIYGFKLINPERNVDVHIEKGLNCIADESLMYIVLENLLSNAWKYTSKKEMAKIVFGKITENGVDTFFVQDNGAGFDATINQKLFTPFERFHSSAEFPGIGIGLATVKRVIDRLGGTIRAESKLDEGTTFYWTVTR